MASIDKIYGNKYQHEELIEFLKIHNPKLLKYVFSPEEYKDYNFDEIRVVSYFPEEDDMWLIDNCPIDFVQKRLKEQYEEGFIY